MSHVRFRSSGTDYIAGGLQEEHNDKSALQLLFQDTYSVYVLTLVTLTYSSNQLNRYILTSVSAGLEQGIGFGEGDGESFLYSMLAGPITTIPYCIGVIVTGHLADKYSKVKLLSGMVIGWCIFHGAMAFATEYWMIAVLRGLSIFSSAGYVSVGPGLIADYFPQETRGLAIGIFGWGQPIGQGLVFSIGNALVASYDYHVALFVAAVWAIPLAFLMLFTVKDKFYRAESVDETAPLKARLHSDLTSERLEGEIPPPPRVTKILRLIFTDRVLLCIYLGGAFRYTSQFNWQFFRNQFFINFRGMTDTEVAYFMSWIPIVGGISGNIVFGYISDRLVKQGYGALGRLSVVTAIHVLSVPAVAGVLLSPIYGAFGCVFLDEFFSRYFIAGINTSIIHIVPKDYRVTAMSYAWMCFWLIGGNSTLLSPLFVDVFDNGTDDHESLQIALFILYLGSMALSSVFFCISCWVFYREFWVTKDPHFQWKYGYIDSIDESPPAAQPALDEKLAAGDVLSPHAEDVLSPPVEDVLSPPAGAISPSPQLVGRLLSPEARSPSQLRTVV